MKTIGITRPDAAETLWVLGDQVRMMGEVAGTDLHVVDIIVPPGCGTPPHHHPSIEIFRVAEGEVTFGIFGEGPPRQVTAGPGTVVTVPSGVGHNYFNAGIGPAVMTVVLQRSMVEFFQEAASREAPPPGPPSQDAISRVLAIGARYGVELLPPA